MNTIQVPQTDDDVRQHLVEMFSNEPTVEILYTMYEIHRSSGLSVLDAWERFLDELLENLSRTGGKNKK